MTKQKEMALAAIEALEDKKGEDVTVIDISTVSVLADYFVIASGTNHSQVQAMIDGVGEKLAKMGYEPKNIEGYHSGNWILMDYSSVVINIFLQETRELYALEHLWGDSESVDLSDYVTED